LRIADCGLQILDCGLLRQPQKSNCGLQIGDCGLKKKSKKSNSELQIETPPFIAEWLPFFTSAFNPPSEIRNPKSVGGERF